MSETPQEPSPLHPSPPTQIRMVVDSSVLLPILANPGRDCHWMVKLWDQGLAVPLVNDRTTQEIRRKLLEWSPTPKPLQAQRFVQNCLRPYERNWEMVPWEDMAHTPRCSDPEDQMFINLGVAGNADILVARDRSLLMMDGDLPFRIMNEQDFRGAILG